MAIDQQGDAGVTGNSCRAPASAAAQSFQPLGGIGELGVRRIHGSEILPRLGEPALALEKIGEHVPSAEMMLARSCGFEI